MSKSFGGEAVWPKAAEYRVQFSLSCGYVIVDPDGRESTLGYANKAQAEDVASKMNEAAGRRSEPEFTWSSHGPFTVQEQAGLPGDRVVFSAVDPSTGITTGAWDTRERAASDARALNAAYHLGRNHESHDAGKIVQAARDVHATRQDDACNDAPHSVHIDTNAAIALADAIEWYDTRNGT